MSTWRGDQGKDRWSIARGVRNVKHRKSNANPIKCLGYHIDNVYRKFSNKENIAPPSKVDYLDAPYQATPEQPAKANKGQFKEFNEATPEQNANEFEAKSKLQDVAELEVDIDCEVPIEMQTFVQEIHP